MAEQCVSSACEDLHWYAYRVGLVPAANIESKQVSPVAVGILATWHTSNTPPSLTVSVVVVVATACETGESRHTVVVPLKGILAAPRVDQRSYLQLPSALRHMNCRVDMHHGNYYLRSG